MNSKTRVILWCLVACLLSGALCLEQYLMEKRQIERSIREQEGSRVELFARFFGQRLREVAADVRTLADNQTLQEFLAGDQAMPLAKANGEMALLGRNHPEYDQIRFLDASGQERVRINAGGQIASAADLQRKADRPYFREALPLPAGEIYLSAIDLNMEHGVVERPFKPMLRFAAPVLDARGRPRGVVVINYLGEYLFNSFQELDPLYQDRFRVLNSAGFWLRGARREDEWGFMLPDRSASSLRHTEPGVWAEITAGERGQSRGLNGLFTWRRISPAQVTSVTGVKFHAADDSLVIASDINAEGWNGAFLELRRRVTEIGAGLLLLSTISTWLFYSRRQARETLNFSNVLLAIAFKNSPDGMLVVGMDGKVLSLNERFVEMWRIPPQVADVKAQAVLLKSLLPSLADPNAFLESGRYIYEHLDEKVHDEIALRDDRTFERHCAALLDSADRHLGRIWFFHDITDRKRAEKDLAKLARTDALTGLANRATFAERLSIAFAASRRGAVPFAVLFLDLDHFKQINDTLGHHAGDVVLQQAAKRMSGGLRDTDLVARFGGDEFAILQSDSADISQVASLATRILTELAQPYEFEGHSLGITASIGIAFYSPGAADTATIVEQADRALYLAKQEGKNRFRFHSGELDHVAQDRMSLAGELTAAIANDELELHYQPQMAVATRKIVGVEALVRWNHPVRGVLNAGRFIPAAEQNGMIVLLGDWVLNQACRQYRLWLDAGVAPPVIAVNLSGAQLKLRRDFSVDVAATLGKWGLAPSDLEFEISESVLAESSGLQADTLRQLRRLGVGLTLDDFGYESTLMGRVKAYGVTRFKVAPEFLDRLASGSAGAAAIQTIIDLTTGLGVELIAKNIETRKQENILASMPGYPMAQGHYYCEPLGSVAMTELLELKPQGHSPVLSAVLTG